ncbi:AraC family transcriptional regulator [Hahella sp. CCB-MM4]|uniref:AraC family transcriptional regulator n=1 Tax=Hahella sp. (strain CCB-MM4) TaxID=1926491 RepID=UPI000B9A67EB|nr:AraC family transcriptional regulator [Hahella sp. CCB-MM4]OZG75346.1 AraC family transcriptional regulator [Hahella sp. CCB-MM4]
MRGHYINALIDVLEELGVNRREFLLRCHVEESELTSDTLLDPDRIRAVTETAVSLCPGQTLGLEVGRRLNINTHGPLGYAAMASATYADALGVLLKYYKVQAPRVRFDIRDRDGWIEIQIDPSYSIDSQPWLTTEFLVTSIYCSTEFLLSGHLTGIEVWFSYPPPPHEAQYSQIFRVPVKFRQPFSGMLISSEVARYPLPSADPAMAQLFAKRCESMQQMLAQDNLPDRIRQILFVSCPDIPTLSELAERLHVSVSTLHRKLSDNGRSYKDLVAEVKQQLARQHLEAGELTIDEIAHVLGFSDASNFRRAFVGWTGMTPSQYRDSIE